MTRPAPLTQSEIARAIRAADQAEVEHYTREYDRMRAVMGRFMLPRVARHGIVWKRSKAMPKPFEFKDPYTLVNEGDGVFSLRCHSIRMASYAVQSWGSEQRCIEAAWALAYAPLEARITLEGVRGAVARGWCAPENSHKEMDPDLADAIAREVYALVSDA